MWSSSSRLAAQLLAVAIGATAGSMPSGPVSLIERASVPTNLPGNWTSKGCYTDLTSGVRALSAKTYTDTTSMTVESCIAFCGSSSPSYIYAAVEYGQECYCDNVIASSSTSVDISQCGMSCTGNSAETCGDSYRLNVFWSGGTGPVSPPTVGDWQSQGCYVDSVSDRTLGTSVVVSGDVTVESCTQACFNSAFPYAGMEYSDECYCADALPSSATTAPAADCAMTCQGNNNEFCGGSNRLNIYKYGGNSLPTFGGAPSAGATYNLQDTVVGSGFYDFFQFQAIPDPTNGRVNYVDKATALAKNLTYASADHFVLRADYQTTLAAGDPGRNSVRLMSNKQFTKHVIVFNVRHMPQGCGTWPALWEVGGDWPNQGEIDILEGVNDVPPNAATLHTSDGCYMPTTASTRGETGVAGNLDCRWYAGCGVQSDSQISYGPAFNNNGGGWYAMERAGTIIKVWFWPRNVGNPPSDVLNPGSTVNTVNWGKPFAAFPNTHCDINGKFGPQNIIINLTFCGDWAGATFTANGCPSDCVSYVNSNPGAFVNAYFDIASIRTYV